MARLSMQQDIIPVNQFRNKLASYVKKVANSNDQVVVTQHGRAAAVLVSPSVIDEIEESKALVHGVLQGLHEAHTGATVSSQALFASIEQLIAAQGEPLEDPVE